MADFLTRLAQRALEPSAAVRPDAVPVFSASPQYSRGESLEAFDRAPPAHAESRAVDESRKLADSSPVDLPNAGPGLRTLAPENPPAAPAAPVHAFAVQGEHTHRSVIAPDASNGPASRPAIQAFGEQRDIGPLPTLRSAHRSEPAQIQPRSREPSEGRFAKPQLDPGERSAIKITIGRIEVRTTSPGAPPARQRPAAPSPQPRSLDSYLSERNGRAR